MIDVSKFELDVWEISDELTSLLIKKHKERLANKYMKKLESMAQSTAKNLFTFE